MTMKRCSKFLAWLLTLIMVFSMMPVAVFADGEDDGNNGASATTTTTLSLAVPGDTLGISGKSGALTVYANGKYVAVINAVLSTSKYRRQAKEVTVVDGAVFCRSGQEPSIWTIEKAPDAGDGYYYLKNGNEYLTLTVNDGVVMTTTPTAVLVSEENGKLRFKSPQTDKWLTFRDNKASSGISCDVNKGETHFELLPVETSDKVIAEFNCNGAPDTINPVESNIGDVITLPNYEGDYIGKELVGWKSSSDNKTYNIGDEFTLPDKMSVAFTAVWQTRQIVVFDANGGSVEAPSSVTIKQGTTSITLPDYNGTKEGYKFIGWATTEKPYATIGNNPYEVYRAETEYTVKEKNNKLYAVWSSLEEVKVEFGIRKDGKIPKEPGNYDSSAYSAHVKTVQRVGEQRWVVDTSTSGRIEGNHLVNDVTRNLSYLPTDNELKEIYPDYDPENQYVLWYVMKHYESQDYDHIDGVILDRHMNAITYDNNTLEKVKVPLGYQVETGSTIVAGAEKGQTAAADPVRNGYNFVGWNTQADGQGTSYNTGDSITVSSSLTLYAIWSKGALKVTVKNTDEKESILTGASFKLNKAATTLTTLSSNGSCDTLENDTVYSLEETIAPKGHTKLSERFFFKVATDAEDKLAMQICDSTGKQIETPEWLTISDATVTNGITQITITVKDEPVKYEVAYNLEQPSTDVTVPAPEYYEKDGKVTLLDAPDLDDYIFSGWMIDGQKISGDTFDMPEKDVTIEGIYYGPIDVKIVSDWEGDGIGYDGAVIKMTAVTTGPENMEYAYQWQYLKDGEWINLDGETGVTYTYTLDAETSGRRWRVMITDAWLSQNE